MNAMLKILNSANIAAESVMCDFRPLNSDKTVMPFAVVSTSRRG